MTEFFWRRLAGALLSASQLPDADEPAREEDEEAADDDLEAGREEGGVHVAVADPGNDDEFHHDDGAGDAGGQVEVADEVGEGVADAAEGGHESADNPTQPGVAATAEL